tara:strand:+ start:3572 stop:4279 length:708 start_codon:yes stop_codon:yes gene_type:complete
MQKAPKILVAAPQSDIKNYCFLDWFLNVKKFNYPKDRIDVFLADNSDSEENSKLMESFGIKVKHIPKKGRGIIEVIAECHQACLDYAKENGYDYMLHLETDIFPNPNIIVELMSHKKQSVCGLYNILNGAYREPMVRLIEAKNDGYMKAYGISKCQGLYIDGKLLKVYSGALGCNLISSSIFDQIKFRSDETQHQFPDTWFAQDLYAKNIPIYVDTKSICQHRSTSWGTYNINFK